MFGRKKEKKKGAVKELVDLSIKEMNEMGEVSDACGQFRALLMDQLARVADMEASSREPKDFKTLPVIKIGVCAGDGIGPFIMDEALKVLETLLADEIAKNHVQINVIEGLTIENRLKAMEAVPKDVLEKIKECDVLLKGPTTTPKGGSMESANVTLRRELDLYANVRPVKVPEEGIDWMFFRENTEGEYVLGSKGVEIPGKLAFDFKVTTELGTKRIARKAMSYARDNGKKKIAVVTKANIMKKTDGNFSRICHEEALNFPELELEDWYIDIMSANLVNKDIRSGFQVFVMPNLYGDILTDEAAEIQGGVGTAGSVNMGDQYAMFEAIHGSAPRMIEDGLQEYANPASIMRAVELMLAHIGFNHQSEVLSEALDKAEQEIVVTGLPDGGKCKDFSARVLELIK